MKPVALCGAPTTLLCHVDTCFTLSQYFFDFCPHCVTTLGGFLTSAAPCFCLCVCLCVCTCVGVCLDVCVCWCVCSRLKDGSQIELT